VARADILGARGVAWMLVGLVTALAALTPMLGLPLYGAFLGHDADFAINGVHMLGAAWGQGEFWPRWMLDTNHGLGGTTYYSYPPLSHWIATAIAVLLGVEAPDGVAIAIALWRLLSVLTAWLWLRRHVPQTAALCGAAFAALLPYAALVNPWTRTAYAETAAATLLPLLFLALERAVEGRRTEGIAVLAMVYAALALTNLPTCALAAHLGPLYAFGYAGWRGLLRAVLGGAAGAMLAAAFLVPALSLLRYANAAKFFNPLWQDNLLGYSIPDRFVWLIWASGILMFILGLLLLRPAFGAMLPAQLTRPGLPRALALLLVVGFALSTVLALPLWWAMPQLAATEHPWRSYGHLVPVLGALVALAVARRERQAWLIALGLPLALAVPGFLLVKTQLGHGAWRNFADSPGERLKIAQAHYRAYSWEHLPRAAAAAGWVGITTRGGKPPYPLPDLPDGAERLPNGFHIPQAVAPFRLPQFYFPVWEARDSKGPVPLRASPEGFIEVAVDRPVQNLEIRIRPTAQERVGWVISLLTALVLIAMVLERAPWRPAALARS
jgi:hypothetical protein